LPAFAQIPSEAIRTRPQIGDLLVKDFARRDEVVLAISALDGVADRRRHGPAYARIIGSTCSKIGLRCVKAPP
jgi:hypothetical protein